MLYFRTESNLLSAEDRVFVLITGQISEYSEEIVAV
jgi:hypothetical protein